MTSFTVSIPSLPAITFPIVPMVPLLASIKCADGSHVIRTQDYLDGLSGSTTTFQRAFRTSGPPVINQATDSVSTVLEIENTAPNNVVPNILSALSNVQGLCGDLLSTIVFDVAAALSAANTLSDSGLPKTLTPARNLATITRAPIAVAEQDRTTAPGILSSLAVVPSSVGGVASASIAVVKGLELSSAGTAVANSGMAVHTNMVSRSSKGLPSLSSEEDKLGIVKGKRRIIKRE